jgi:hypothetical protein
MYYMYVCMYVCMYVFIMYVYMYVCRVCIPSLVRLKKNHNYSRFFFEVDTKMNDLPDIDVLVKNAKLP